MKRLLNNGFFLVFVLLLTSLITTSAVVIFKVTISNKENSDNSILETKLNTIAKQNITSIINTLDPSKSGITNYLNQRLANRYLVNIQSGNLSKACNITEGTVSSGSTITYVCSSSTTNTASIIRPFGSYIFPNSNTINLSISEIGMTNQNSITAETEFNFQNSITQTSYTNNNLAATYTLSINSTVCNVSKNVCKNIGNDYKVTLSCPATDQSVRLIPLRSLTNAEVNLISGLTTEQRIFPNLYCACNDSLYPIMSSRGICCHNTNINVGGECGCDQGQYLSSSGICMECPNQTYSSSPGTSSTCTPSTPIIGCQDYSKAQDICIRCASGHYSTEQIFIRSKPVILCLACDDGTYSTYPNTTKCITNTRDCDWDNNRSSPILTSKSKTANECLSCFGTNNSRLKQDKYYLEDDSKLCSPCPRDSWSRCQCDGKYVGKDAELFRGVRLLSGCSYNDTNYWKQHCNGSTDYPGTPPPCN